MSSGDSTIRAWCGATSIHRTLPLAAGSPKRLASSASCAARSASLTKSGASSLTCSRPSRAASQDTPMPSSASTNAPPAARSSQRNLSVPRGSRSGPAAASRNSRAARSQAAVSSCHGTSPRAWLSPCPSMSRAKSSTWPAPKVVPRNCTPASASWCASSNTATSTLGSSSATPVSRSAMSAKNRWWFTTTRSAAMASRRALITWQRRNSGHSWPRQFSRDEVTSAMTLLRSSSPSSSARSPLTVRCDHCSTLAKVRTAQRSGNCADWRAWFMRCRHR